MFDEYIATPKPILLTATELRSFNNATTCHICTKSFGDDKVRDYCVIVGRYRGVPHNECNLMYMISKSGWKLSAVNHNLKCSDGHLIVKALKSECTSDSAEHISFVGQNNSYDKIFPRTKSFVGQNLSSDKTFRRRKSFVGQNHSSDKIFLRTKSFVGQNLSSDKLFRRTKIFRLKKSLSDDRFSQTKDLV